MNKLKLAFFGTPDFAGSFLEKILLDSELPVEVKLVVTQPDRPVGRKQVLTPTPVKAVANRHKIPLFEGKVKDLLATIKDTSFDLAMLYAYGEIIPSDLIVKFPVGFWNIHPSLLPLYRNVAPMAYPLMLGDEETGVTMIQLDDKLDHGPILAQETLRIDPTDKRPDLEKKLSDLAFKIFKTAVLSFPDTPTPVPQDHSKATFTRLMKKDDGFIPLDLLQKFLANEPVSPTEFPQILREYFANYPATKVPETSSLLLYNFFRGLYPWPGIWTKVTITGEEKRLKITDMKYENEKTALTKVQLEGKNEVDFSVFSSAYKIFDWS